MPITIAVVDRDPAILDATELLFATYAWITKTYTSGKVFLGDLTGGAVPDCLILDPRLPGMTGADVVKAFLKHTTDSPIVILTAEPDGRAARRAINAGANVVLGKPIAPSRLIEIILILLGADELRA